MGLSLVPRKKIEDQVPQLNVRSAGFGKNTEGQLSIGQARQPNIVAVRGAAPRAPSVPTIMDNARQTVYGNPLEGLKGLGINLGAAVQQGAGAIADVGLQAGEVGNYYGIKYSPLLSEDQRNQQMAKLESAIAAGNTPAARARADLQAMKDLEGQNIVGTSDVDEAAGRIAAGRATGQDFASVGGKALGVALDVTSPINPTRLAAGAVGDSIANTAKFIGRDAAFFGSGDAAAAGAQTFGQTGDLGQAGTAALQAGLLSGVSQGALDTAGSAVNRGLRTATGDVATDAASEVIANAADALQVRTAQATPIQNFGQQQAPGTFGVDSALSVNDDIMKRLQEAGITGVYQKESPYGAMYDPNNRAIYVESQKMATEANLYHELGHDVFLNRLTPEERALFGNDGPLAREAQARGYDYQGGDYGSEDFSDMMSKALQGRMAEVPPQFRGIISKYTGVTVDALARSGVDPVVAARAGEVLKQPAPVENPITPRTDLVGTYGKIRELIDVPTQAETYARQKGIELQQNAQLPRVTKAELPRIEKQGNDLPTIETSIDPTDPFNEKNPFIRFRNELAKRGEDDYKMLNLFRRLEKESDFTDLSRQYYYDTGNVRQSNSIANNLITSSPELRDALEGLGDFTKAGKKTRELAGMDSMSDLDRFDEYVSARVEANNYDGMKTYRSPEENARIVADGDAEFADRFASLNQYYKKEAQRLADYGIISKEKLAQYQANDNYVRIQRDMEDLVNPQLSRSQSKSLKSTTANQKRKGSEREILSPVRTLLNRTQQLELEVQRNIAASNTIDALAQFGLARKIPSNKITNKNTVGRFVNGKKEYWEVPRDIKKEMESVNPHIMGITARIISLPTRAIRAGATGLSVPFTAKNYLRDQAGSAIQSTDIRATHRPDKIISALGSAVKDFGSGSDDPLWEKFIMHAGEQTRFDELRNVKDTNKVLRGLRQGTKGEVFNKAISPVRTLEDFVSITEKATRFQNFKGIYEKVLKETGNENLALREAVLAARQNSTDFGRSGDFTRVANLFIPFFNATVQGSRTLARAYKQRPMATAMKTLSVVTLPMVAATVYNMADEKRREIYDSLKDFEKEDNFIIIGPDAFQNPDGSWEGIVKIPKAPGYRELTDPVREVTESFLRGQDPSLNMGMLNDVLQVLAGPVDISSPEAAFGSALPQQVKPWVQAKANKDFFRNKDIVPSWMSSETSDPNKQVFEDTSGTARAIGKQIGVSPLLVEQFIKDAGASLGKYGLNTLDRAGAAAGLFPGNQIGGKDAVSDLYSGFAKASGELLDKNKTDTQLHFEKQEKLLEKLNENEKSAFMSLHPRKSNFLGEKIYEGDNIYNSAARLDIYNRYPEVFNVDKKLDQAQRDRGQVGNPLFDLTEAQRKKVLEKAVLPPGAKDPELSKLYSKDWYVDYTNNRNKYFTSIKENIQKDLQAAEQAGKQKDVEKLGKTLEKFSGGGNSYPEMEPDVQQALDQYSALPKGTGDRTNWINSNPDMWDRIQNSFEKIDQWQNSQRKKRGLAATEGDEGEKNGYSSDSSSSGGGYGYGSKGSRGSSRPKKLDPRAYRVSRNAGGSAPSAKVSVAKTEAKTGKYVARKRKELPKVKWKKSLV